MAEVIETRLPEWYGNGSTLDIGNISLHLYPYSFFINFPITTEYGQKDLLAKINRDPDCEEMCDAVVVKKFRERAKEEFAVMQSIWEAFDRETETDCIAVQPFEYVGKWNAIVMQKIDGKPLKGVLLQPSMALRSRKVINQLLGLVRSSTRWLRIFHERVSVMEYVTLPEKNVWSTISRSLSRLDQLSGGNIAIESYQLSFRKAMEDLRGEKVPVGVVHDDYHYSNILATRDNKICAIDNSGNYQACAYVDLATFITDPQTRMVQVITGGLYISTDFIQSCKEMILRTYFGQEAYSSQVMDFFCAIAILNKWSEGLARFSVAKFGTYSAIFIKWTERYFSKLLSAYLP